jgi:hypothetical protein
MAIVINPSDPGAVPGASTTDRKRLCGLCWGRNRIDEGVKDGLLPEMVSDVTGHFIVANDNYAPAALAA